MDRPWYEFQPKERAAAKKAGMKQYFTGRPCKQGHVAYRCTANGTCNECASIKQKTKLEKKLLQDPDYYKKKYAENPNYYRQKSAKYRAENPEKTRQSYLNSIRKRKPQKAAYERARHAKKIASNSTLAYQRALETNGERVYCGKTNKFACWV